MHTFTWIDTEYDLEWQKSKYKELTWLFWNKFSASDFSSVLHCFFFSSCHPFKTWFELLRVKLYRGYYMVARRYEFYFRVAKQCFTNERREWVKYCFCHEKIKFIYSSCCVMFFLLSRLKDIDKIIEGNYLNYVIDKLMCEIMENKPLASRM